MTTPDSDKNFDISRRRLLAAAGIGTGVLLTASFASAEEIAPAPTAIGLTKPVMTPPVAGLHLQFGADASAEMVVSWHTLQPVKRPRVLIGRLDGKLEQTVAADEVNYVDAKSNQTVYAYHAKVGGLDADASYLYAALHEGAEPQFGTFRTSPRGRQPLRFTSFGDQGTPPLGGYLTHRPV
ncbi:purple acid phosphatase-like protein [Rhizobium sp. ERR 1071]|uniref:fibronectin type III domain-containing protein n=1 Tax=Rhizobium sp. ERR 1071 TaxID=2572677 RepID=UPI0011991F35|nr:fibronectin type III domain-containing protein [Rhizobium sp. ERR1071]TWB19560.1 purple acid phosphatase-like protein [Rhizobium sp. ERR1071]